MNLSHRLWDTIIPPTNQLSILVNGFKSGFWRRSTNANGGVIKSVTWYLWMTSAIKNGSNGYAVVILSNLYNTPKMRTLKPLIQKIDDVWNIIILCPRGFSKNEYAISRICLWDLQMPLENPVEPDEQRITAVELESIDGNLEYNMK